MAITAADVKKLRDKTGAGMMDCKNALTEAEGDFAKAERILKELGKAAAAKRSGRATNEGRIFTRTEGNTGLVLELACETDFVARNETFVALGESLAQEILERNLTEADEAIENRIRDAISTIKENMSLRRFSRIEKKDNEIFASYIHGDSGRLGCIVALGAEDPAALERQDVKDFAFDCALHAVAFRPTYLSEDSVDPEYLAEQKEIFMTQAKNMDKPEKVLQGIAQGKLKKHLAEICFLDQGFVKDEKKSVSTVAQELSKTAGTSLSLSGYLVYAVGEEA
ncbi:elongation factor Ts [Alkalispirochaeta americana]|uniref:Elongation factor Ts n=1 Tax=Alkalispirochaeta americana TaxID=159291 RepID=A0A1N6PT01_9SPIO|nr:translation elongation factor Ts [Alkalispirochaeta americana]SIQ07451.1 elongation factor Ts [Alkalispirochaeta americana]